MADCWIRDPSVASRCQRTFYARGQTGQQLLLGAYQALEEQIAAGTVTMHTRRDVLDVVLVDGKARGIVTRNMVTGEIDSHAADVVVLATGGYWECLLSIDQRQGFQLHCYLESASPRRAFCQPLFYADPSDVYSC